MDGHGFDLLTKRLALLITRRQGGRLALAAAGAAGLLGMEMDGADAACGGPGTRCKNGKPCCSGICLRGRKKRGKKTKKGRCDCSFPQEGCNVGGDCCFAGSTCGDNGCDPDNRCCFGAGAECIDPCECCDGFTCDFEGGGEFGVCVPCRALQEACVVDVDFCCDNGTFCDENGSGEGDVCCLDRGFACEDDLDCCGDDRCSSRFENTCQNCLSLGDFCNPQNNQCCDKDADCFDDACGNTGNRCCLIAGAACEETCDCCEDHLCHPTTKTCVFDLSRRGAESKSEGAAIATDEGAAEGERERGTRRRSGKSSVKRRRRR